MSDASSGPPGDGGDRRTPRRRVLLTGLVAYPDLSISFRCAIRDRSASGARIKIPENIIVPNKFWLIDVSQGFAYDATAVWRRYPEVGVALADPIALEYAERDLMQRRLRALWIEIAPRR